MKIKVTSLICVVLMLVALIGCGGSGGGSSDSSGGSVSNGPVVDLNFAEKQFTIIRPDGNKTVQELATSVFKAIKDNNGAKLTNASDSETVNPAGEILVGDTNRPQSQKAKDLLFEKGGVGRLNEYIICYIDGSIVINALSDDALKTGVEKFIADYTKTCSIKTDLCVVFTDKGSYKDVTLGGVAVGRYKFVIPDYNMSYLVTMAIEDFNDKLFEVAGVKIPTIQDTVAAGQYEIVVDNCNRDGVNKELVKKAYEIKQDGTKVLVNGGYNYSKAYAVRQLIDLIPAEGGEIKATVSGTYDMKNDLDGYTLVWDEEFDTLSTDTWKIQEGKGADWYGGWFGRTTWRSSKEENLKVKDGKLYMTATYDDKYFYGAYMTTADSMTFTKGYMEISARIADGRGVWHDWWTWSNDKNHLEFDIMECWGGAFRYVNYIHEFVAPDAESSAVDTEVAYTFVHKNEHFRQQYQKYDDREEAKHTEKSMNTEFHNFGCEWTDERVIMTRDGEVTLDYKFADTNSAFLYEQPHYFIFSMLVGANYGNETPEYVDENKKSMGYPMLDGDYWGNDKGSFIVEYCQLYQKPGQYLNAK